MRSRRIPRILDRDLRRGGSRLSPGSEAGKIRREQRRLTLALEATPDILASEGTKMPAAS